MLLAFAAFTVAGLATGTAFLASYAAEHGLPFDLPVLALPRFALAPAAAPQPPAPTWCEATRRWRDPVTRSFVKAPR